MPQARDSTAKGQNTAAARAFVMEIKLGRVEYCQFARRKQLDRLSGRDMARAALLGNQARRDRGLKRLLIRGEIGALGAIGMKGLGT